MEGHIMSTNIFNSAGSIDLAKTPDKLGALSFAGAITRLMPNGSAPLFGLTSMLKSETAVQIEHGYYAKIMLFPEGKINGAVNAAATTFVLDTTANLLPGMVMQVVGTDERVLILTVESATDITVRRAFGTIAAAGS